MYICPGAELGVVGMHAEPGDGNAGGGGGEGAMQPELSESRAGQAYELGMAMERVILSVRRVWFGARELPMGCATALIESGGEMLMFVDGDAAGVENLLAGAAGRGAYVVSTSFSRPSDLAARLCRRGFRLVHRHGAYVLDPDAYRAGAQHPTPAEGKRSLLSMFWRRTAPDIRVEQIGEDGLLSWNEVCWQAFGRRGNEVGSHQEKLRAFRGMGAAARWYLVLAGDRPVGTALLYQTPHAAQVLAVGTLPSFRQRGVASAVMHRLIQDWLAEGSGFLFLDTEPGSAAERLYCRLGFRQAYIRELYAPGEPLS